MSDEEKQDETSKDGEKSTLHRLFEDLGLEKKFVGSVLRDTIKEAIRSQIPGIHKTDNKSKFGKTVETIKSLWWVPAAVYISVMLAVILIKFLSRMMEI